MRAVARGLVLVLCVGACGDNVTPPVPEPDPRTATARSLFGLEVGARWTYLRSGDVLRWKEITACEDVLVIDPDTGERRVVRAYVRENRSTFGTTSVHYLIVDEDGAVRRVRRDDVDEGALTMFATYAPAGLRLPPGPYRAGTDWSLSVVTGEFDPVTELGRGVSATSAVDKLLRIEDVSVFGGTYPAIEVWRQWDANNPHDVHSFYSPHIGEIREVTSWPRFVTPPVQVEELVVHTPGYGTCDGTAIERACAAPLAVCDDAWDTGVRGCSDPRVDPANCGGCGQRCESGVCAGGRCQDGACAMSCEGATVCCPFAWDWGGEGCTSPSRDPNNCGGCGQRCGPGLTCDHGECTCGPGTADCGSGCQDMLADDRNCGACGHACGGATPNCDKGVCVATCLSVELTTCADACVDVKWNDDHCGACDRPCGDGHGTTTCQNGACVSCAAANMADCNGDCADLDWSDKHCGSCDRRCSDEQVCIFGTCVGGDGTCVPPCTAGDKICCNGSCIDPRVNDQHCGGCRVNVCAGGCTEACRAGSCVAVDCGGGDD